MKYLKKLNEYFKIFENTLFPLFKNEHKLQELLLQDKDFAKGDTHQALINIPYNERDLSWSYNNMLNCSKTFGALPLLSLYLGSYNYQICNGGHEQYFDNGFASSNSRGFGYNYKEIETHEDFIKLFNELNMNSILPSGQKAYNIMLKFDLTYDDDTETCDNCSGDGNIDCDKCDGGGSVDCLDCEGDGEDQDGNSCENCDGKGTTNCEDCEGSGHINCEDCDGSGYVVVEEDVADKTGWDKLDTEWYEINDNVMKEFNDYLKTLTLNGEKMTDLIEIANGIQKYNL
jgi:hypothetical protein